jgi:hypothetical protein
MLSVEAHASDVNVIAWNRATTYMLVRVCWRVYWLTKQDPVPLSCAVRLAGLYCSRLMWRAVNLSRPVGQLPICVQLTSTAGPAPTHLDAPCSHITPLTSHITPSYHAHHSSLPPHTHTGQRRRRRRAAGLGPARLCRRLRGRKL